MLNEILSQNSLNITFEKNKTPSILLTVRIVKIRL